MNPQESEDLGTAPPLSPGEIDALLGQDAETRAEWMLEDCARHSQAFGLENEDGWVVFKLAQPPEGAAPWAFPLWPRRELAALAARDSSEKPIRIALEDLLGAMVPEVDQRGWQILACPHQEGGFSLPAGEFGRRLAESWDELNEEEG